MRAVFIVTVLMLAPLAQGIGDGFFEIKKSGSEQILHLDEGVWGQEEWDNLDGSGFTPLCKEEKGQNGAPSTSSMGVNNVDVTPLIEAHTKKMEAIREM